MSVKQDFTILDRASAFAGAEERSNLDPDGSTRPRAKPVLSPPRLDGRDRTDEEKKLFAETARRVGLADALHREDLASRVAAARDKALPGRSADMVDALMTGFHLPTDAAQRKALPICTGVLDYFPDAIAAVAEVSRIGNDQHNPGQPLHWAKGKSTDHADCALRHFAERGTRDSDGGRHTAKAAWRVLAQLQMEIEAERAGLSFNDYIAKLKEEASK